MLSLKTGLWTLALLALGHEVGATTVQRCVGNSGQVTFTHTSCPDGVVGRRERVRSPAPGSVAPTVREAASQKGNARPPRVADAATGANAARKSATAPKQMLPVKEKVEMEKKGKKKKKVKYTPWQPPRS